MFPPEVFQSLLVEVARLLAARNVRFALTGGLVSAFYSEPRYTQDADILIHRDEAHRVLEVLIKDFEAAGFLLDQAAIRQAVSTGRQFQLFHPRELLKLDFYPRELVPGELERAVPAEIFPGVMFPIITSRDLVACKLIWISKGSHKSRRDVRQLIQRMNQLDRTEVRKLAAELGNVRSIALETRPDVGTSHPSWINVATGKLNETQ